MQSNNPVFRRQMEEYSGSGAGHGAQGYPPAGTTYPGQAPYGQAPYGQQPYGAPTSFGAPGGPEQYGFGAPPAATAPMTIDSVVQRTAISVGLVIVSAMATWILTPDLTDAESAGSLYAALLFGSLGAFALSMVNSFKRKVSPALVMAFAVLEGIALGAFSKVLDNAVAPDSGIVSSAVFGTFAAFAGTLAAYKFLNIKVTDKFRRGVVAAMFGMLALGLIEMVLRLFGNGVGIFGFGAAGALFAVGGLVLGIFMLILDFDFVEQGIRYGLPEVESWRAAFAMTVSLVWIYTNLLRLLAIFNQE